MSRFALYGSELEEFWNTLGMGVGLEASEEFVDEADAVRCADLRAKQAEAARLGKRPVTDLGSPNPEPEFGALS